MGYIGLPTAAICARAGHDVTGVDITPAIVEKINAGKSHIVEPGLEECISNGIDSNKLKASLKPEAADIFLIIVPTPFIEENKKPDMGYVQQASKDIAPHLVEGNLIVLESTSALGATENDVKAIIESERPDLVGKLHFAFCPERAIPGDTMRELVENDRVVGGMTDEATDKAVSFYKTFVKGEVLPTTAATAELVKLVENSFRDVNIAFANELSLVCDKLGINVWETIRLANHHPRVNILQPGPGVGGHCIAIDPWFIVDAAPEEAKLIRTAREVNDGKPHWVVSKVRESLNGKQNATVALLGLAFKPNVDDLRESPSVKVARAVKDQIQANVIAVEPYITQSDEFSLVPLEDALLKADVVVMLTDHQEFKQITWEQLRDKTVIDTRGAFEKV